MGPAPPPMGEPPTGLLGSWAAAHWEREEPGFARGRAQGSERACRCLFCIEWELRARRDSWDLQVTLCHFCPCCLQWRCDR